MRAAVFAISLGTSCATVLLLCTLAASLQGRLGVWDLRLVFPFFVPAGLIAAGLVALTIDKVSRWPLRLRLRVGVGVGLGLGLLWTFVIFQGSWDEAMGLPALICWMTGGASGVATGMVSGADSWARFRTGSIVALVAIAATGVGLREPLATLILHDQTLTVRFLRLEHGREPLTIEGVDGIKGSGLSDTEVALLRAAQPTGRLIVVWDGRLWSGRTFGRGPAASALIVLNEPVQTSASIQQPDRTTAVYLQNHETFAIYPPAVKTLERNIGLYLQGNSVECLVRVGSGAVRNCPTIDVWRQVSGRGDR